MKKYDDIEIELLSIQVGCVLRYERLKRKLSQETLGQSIGSNSTMIGRIERAENICSWQRLLLLCQILEIEVSDLLEIKSKEYILNLIENSLRLEDKLTQDKKDYYKFLKKRVSKFFKL